jgi:predicted PurR-regulated permease PerM
VAMKNRSYLPEIPASWLAVMTLVVLGIVGLFVLMIMNPNVLLILVAGLFLGIAIKPAVSWMGQHGMPQEIGAALIFISLLVVLGAFIGFVLPLLAMQTVNLTTALGDVYLQIRQSLVAVPNLLVRQVVQALPEDFRLLQPMMTQPEPAAAENSLDAVRQVLGQVFGAGLEMIFVFFLAINWSVEGDRIVRTALLLTNHRRELIQETIFKIEEQISRYLRGLGLLSLIVGALALTGYLIIGLPYALILAVFAGLMEAVPVIGPAIGAVPAILVALSISPGAAVAVIVVSILIQALENVWILPRVMGSTLGVPPFITLIAMLAFSTLFGIVGTLIAIPVAAVIQILLEAVAANMRAEAGNDIGRDRVSAVRYEIKELVGDIRSRARTRNFDADGELYTLEDSLEAIALDLDALLDLSHTEERA